MSKGVIVVIGVSIHELYVLALAVALLVLSVLIFKDVNVDSNLQDQTVSDWNTLPYVDFQINQSGCSAGYDYVALRTWPGTSSGCYCLTSILYSTSCTSNQTDDGCV